MEIEKRRFISIGYRYTTKSMNGFPEIPRTCSLEHPESWHCQQQYKPNLILAWTFYFTFDSRSSLNLPETIAFTSAKLIEILYLKRASALVTNKNAESVLLLSYKTMLNISKVQP